MNVPGEKLIQSGIIYIAAPSQMVSISSVTIGLLIDSSTLIYPVISFHPEPSSGYFGMQCLVAMPATTSSTPGANPGAPGFQTDKGPWVDKELAKTFCIPHCSLRTTCLGGTWNSATMMEGCRIVEAVNTRGVGQTELTGAKNDRTIVWSFKSSH
ncbi:hypothetical protein DFH08DRAFT_803990 [Mycena albidolilacea]|uniref:Uncharacterized protein n=1 Tax=Mycena albidolilacea TaxID=1033008 RepID=A0AAD7AB27_9AGAR|nr:hypothetical protein DFH08DRAFT_803990 [Mycena albidolilacea]